MNYLQLCVRAWEESGYSGAGPTTVIGNTGQLGKMVNWVQQAWIDIQLMRPNWLFMHSEFLFNTTVDQRDYVADDEGITDMKLWDINGFLIFETALDANDQNFLQFLEYDIWMGTYRIAMDVRPSDRPIVFTILPDNKVRFEPNPDKIYTIEGSYKRSTQTFVADVDVPTNLPSDFHQIIVWKALTYYGFFENAPETLDLGETNFDNLLLRLEEEQLMLMSESYEALA